MILVDASVWIAFFNGRDLPERFELARLLGDSSAPLAIADLTVYEVLRGFRHEKDFLAAKRNLAVVTCVAIGGAEIAQLATDHYRALRAIGLTSDSTVDLMLGAYCIANNHALLHHDRDFDALEAHRGLKVWRPALH
jgi:predicted nucleic acid-binding protein